MRVLLAVVAVCAVTVQGAFTPSATFSQFDQECLAERNTNANFDCEANINLLKKDVLIEAYEGQKNCQVTGFAPSKPRSLSFCHKFNDNACCPPTLDMENNEMFDSMFDLGLSCRLRGDVRENPIAKLYCMNCDPQQPRYTRDVNRGADGKPKTVLVCKDWAESEFVLDPLFEPFNRCGLMVSATCQDATETDIPGRDRYLCGDDLIIPGQQYLESDNPLEDFLNEPNLGPPFLDEDTYFQIVTNTPCTGSHTNLSLSPDCLLSAEQVAERSGRSATFATDCDSNTYLADANNAQDCVAYEQELCFNGAATTAASLVAVLLSIALTLVLL
eukprot:m.479431 g.479431  ORF g.479431 m.479431 type:complete len:330 (+) comp21445_c0_seq1:279-1268(+)